MESRIAVVFIGLLTFFAATNAFSGQPEFVAGETFQVTSDKPTPEALAAFLAGAPNIDNVEIEDANTGSIVSVLNRGGRYIFWVLFNPTLCDDYYMEIGAFRNGRRVFYIDWSGPNQGGDCNISGTGIYIDVPENAPTGDYTWGGRTTNFLGQDTFYPAGFSIQ